MLLVATNTSDRLRSLRKLLDLTQREMAQKLGVALNAYKNWEYGHEPPSDILRQVDDLERKTPEISPFKIPAPTLDIPIPYIGHISASSPMHYSDPLESDEFEYVPSHMGDDKGLFCCRILGDSMYPLLHPEDLCVFKKSEVPRLGCVILFRSHDDKCTVKTLKHNGTEFYLQPENRGYEIQPATGSVVGFLIGYIRMIGLRRITDHDPTGIRP